MAENKKSFLLYCDIIHTVKKLSNEQSGVLFKHILSYVNDEKPVTDDIVIELVFEPIKQSLLRDLEKYENICNRNKLNGIKGGRPLKPKKPIGLIGNPKNPKNPSKPKKADSDIDSDSVIDIDNDIYKSFNHLSITISDFEKLKNDFSEIEILDCFEKIENYKQNTKYTSLYLTAKQWLQKQKKDNLQNPKQNGIEFTGKQQFKFSSAEAIKTITGDN